MRSLTDRDLVKTVVSYVYEARLAGQVAVVPELPDVWDLWYVCYRLWRSAKALGVADGRTRSGCPACRELVARLTATSPPAYPAGTRDCFVRWAIKMRSRQAESTDVDSGAMALSFALLKPQAPAGAIRAMLAGSFRIAGQRTLRLTPVDMTRLYPDAYGDDFLAWQSGYLTRAPVEALLLTAPPGEPADVKELRSSIRAALGVLHAAENHLHMPDSAGEAFANIEQFFGAETLSEQYRRIELTRGQRRLALYRTLLGA